jgi:hypothetical protein
LEPVHVLFRLSPKAVQGVYVSWKDHVLHR